MSIIPPGETVVEKKVCRMSGQEFFITDKDIEFYDKISPIFGGKKYHLPAPNLSPDERHRRRLSFRNQRNVYIRKSDITGKNIFSEMSPTGKHIVYENEAYYSDSWTPLQYGRNFDSTLTVNEQFSILLLSVPKENRSVKNLENSDYCNNANDLKDCYLTFAGGNSEKLLYTEMFRNSYSCVDCLGISDSKNCYECISSSNCDSCIYCQNSIRCTACVLCESCLGCHDCFSCTNLANMEYCIANKQYSKEKYFELLATFDIQKLQKESRAWLKKQSKRSFQGVNVENAVGNEIYNLKNAFYCFECYDGENLRYCSNIKTGSNCMDVSNFGWHPEWCYECCVTGHNAQNILFGYDVWLDVSNMIYCQNCRTSQDCFASSGLHNHEHHCILNKPYSIHEYEVLCGKIIDHMISTGEWGEFFDPKLSRFGYNETLAMDYFPLTQDAVRAYGWNWYTEEEKVFSGSSYVPLSLSQYDERVVGYDIAQKNIDECLGGIIQCEATGKPFKIIKQELIFYIENSLPLPTKHPNQRHKERTQLRNPRTLYERHCADCNTDIITTYSPDRPERVVCEECYRKIVY